MYLAALFCASQAPSCQHFSANSRSVSTLAAKFSLCINLSAISCNSCSLCSDFILPSFQDPYLLFNLLTIYLNIKVRRTGFEPAALIISVTKLYSNYFLITQQPELHRVRLPIPPSPQINNHQDILYYYYNS